MSAAQLLTRSEVESRRFGLEVYRAELEAIDEKALLSELLARSVDLAILRIPCQAQGQLARLERIALPYLVADSLVYYFADLSEWTPRALRNSDVVFEPFRAELVDQLDELVGEIFGGYHNHYAANPLLPSVDMLEGYKEWVRGFVPAAGSPRTGWLVRRAGRAVGFCTCDRHDDIGVGVLYGIREDAAGGGLYGDMIRFTQAQLRGAGCRQMEVSTQIHNFAVQKVWVREGFVLRKALATVHVNALLAKSVRPPASAWFSVSEAELEDWGRVSGDRNPLHFSAEFARGRGLDDRLAHGLVLNGMISKHYGTVYPGPGTLFQSYSFGFFRPVYVGTRYRLTLTFPVANEQKGFYRSVARVEDEASRLCLLAYSNLVRR